MSRRAAAAGVLSSLLAAGCAGPPPITEIYLVVDSDLAVRGGLPERGIRVIKLDVLLFDGSPPLEGYTAILNEAYHDHSELPLSWGLYAAGDRRRTIELVARGYERGLDWELPRVEQRARVQFVPDEVRVLCLSLASACVDVECPAEETCDGGACVPIEVESDLLEPYEATDVRCPPGWPVAAP